MKSVSSSLQTHIEGDVTSLAKCLRITRTDGQEFFFTNHDVDISFDGNTYQAETGFDSSAIANKADFSVDNLEITGFIDSAQITEADLRAGLFDFAEARFFVVNWQDLSQGELRLRRGRLGRVNISQTGIYTAELRGLTQSLSQQAVELYGPTCRADLGDSRCKVPINPPLRLDSTAHTLGQFVTVITDGGATGQARFENRIYECTTAGTTAASAPTFNETVGGTTSDGTVTWTARQAWTRHGVVDTVTDRKTFTLTNTFNESRAVDDWFNGGVLTFESGNNNGRSIEIRDWAQSTRTVTQFLSNPFDVSPGDLVRLYPGCDKRDTTCINKFALAGTILFANGNIKNFRGEPFLPGRDELISYPDAKSA